MALFQIPEVQVPNDDGGLDGAEVGPQSTSTPIPRQKNVLPDNDGSSSSPATSGALAPQPPARAPVLPLATSSGDNEGSSNGGGEDLPSASAKGSEDVWRSDEGEEDPHTLAGGGGLAALAPQLPARAVLPLATSSGDNDGSSNGGGGRRGGGGGGDNGGPLSKQHFRLLLCQTWW